MTVLLGGIDAAIPDVGIAGDNAEGRGIFRRVRGIKPWIGQKPLSHVRPAGAGFGAEGGEGQCFGQCIARRKALRAER